ncbi:uncharacterized protein KY384_003687 [Bacidia gigantensis]|uniref:uncharacterized protein n=1 Tax=Bacidia gigantensis TaxID=2732470 RepID=UPI001D04ADD9|nr:uncharacterized protein KY384_003687 [Bacidia gigantensis]KAG8532050.1 hypothetical protein KY384_003687 [Bacidia gigantensis]
MSEFKAAYFAAGGNRHPSAADWDCRSGLLAFGADQNVAIWSPLSRDHKSVKCLLAGHKNTVNAVKFFPTLQGCSPIIVSGSTDKTIRIWRMSESEGQVIRILDDHASSVNCISVNSHPNLVVSGSADSIIKIWHLDLEGPVVETTLLQTIDLAPRFLPLTTALHSLNQNRDLVLAVAGTSSTAHVYVKLKGGIFEHQASLTGHEGWIRSLSISEEFQCPQSDLVLASASQDKYIRLWRIARTVPTVPSHQVDLVDAFEESLSNKRHKLQSSSGHHMLTFEALLLGHEDWIYTVSWHLQQGKLQLLSASADNSLAIWQPEASSGIWIPVTRLGEISLQKGSTTASGSTGGFWVGLWSPDGTSVVSLGRTGSWRLWMYNEKEDRWLQHSGISGHTKSITDIAWSKDGNYLLSTSSDQTTRLNAESIKDGLASWQELARPQIHGYDLNCIDSISSTQFISGADEKLLRVFDEPRQTAELLRRLCGIHSAEEHKLTDSASMPVLGLSNKAGTEPDDERNTMKGTVGNGGMMENKQIDTAAMTMPTEDQLARHTLWPEREKLYGHGYEISAVAASHDGTLVATSCKASSLSHAVIRLYTTKDWREVKPALKAHSLTVTALAFANDDKYLLSTGRDRQWAVFERDSTNASNYIVKHANPKGHSRMILDACWSAETMGRVFATAGRDKAVKIWLMGNGQVGLVSNTLYPSAVSALDFGPELFKGRRLLAVGTESGDLILQEVIFGSWETSAMVRIKES